MLETAHKDFAATLRPPVLTLNRHAPSPLVFICDHASNRIPAEFSGLGLSRRDRMRHIAWDPGALDVAKALARHFHAPLVAGTVSRLVVDPNRAPDAADLIPVHSEDTAIPGNAGIDAGERARRIAAYHAPFHDAISALIDARAARGIESVLVCVHSFTPVYRQVARPWPIGLIPGRRDGLSLALRDALAETEPDLAIGWNEPYAANADVTHTLDHHIDRQGRDGTMLEIRNDEILTPAGVRRWSAQLAGGLSTALGALAAPAEQSH